MRLGLPPRLLLPLLAVVVGCDGEGRSSPSLPTEASVLWAGSRSVLAVTSGADTCLGRMLATRPADLVRLELPATPGRDFFGNLTVGGSSELCVVRGDVEGPTISWWDYRCTENCWWESFDCEGRRWSFCRGWSSGTETFLGEYSPTRIRGSQPYRFYATDGSPTGSYYVELVLAYDLRR